MIETINGKAYLKVGDKVYELGGGVGIDVASAKVGQTIVVKAVDENSKPTEWEAVNLPRSTNIITVDSFEELPQASSVPMRTIALVTSEG